MVGLVNSLRFCKKKPFTKKDPFKNPYFTKIFIMVFFKIYLEIILTSGYPYMPQKIHIQQDVGDDDEMYHIK